MARHDRRSGTSPGPGTHATRGVSTDVCLMGGLLVHRQRHQRGVLLELVPHTRPGRHRPSGAETGPVFSRRRSRRVTARAPETTTRPAVRRRRGRPAVTPRRRPGNRAWWLSSLTTWWSSRPGSSWSSSSTSSWSRQGSWSWSWSWSWLWLSWLWLSWLWLASSWSSWLWCRGRGRRWCVVVVGRRGGGVVVVGAGGGAWSSVSWLVAVVGRRWWWWSWSSGGWRGRRRRRVGPWSSVRVGPWSSVPVGPWSSVVGSVAWSSSGRVVSWSSVLVAWSSSRMLTSS